MTRLTRICSNGSSAVLACTGTPQVCSSGDGTSGVTIAMATHADASGAYAAAARGGYLVFLLLLLGWIDALPIPWFDREPGGVVSFNYHPLFMGVAFVVLMPEALMVYADVEERRGMPHRDAKNLHAALNGGATVLLVAGLAVIFANHAGHGIPPMYSAHSWLGILTASLMACQALVGTAAYLVPSALGVTQETRAALMPHHRFLGCVTFLLGVATCAAGLAEKQSFTKCAPDPTDKFCAAMRLPNLIAVAAVFVAACTLGAVYARWTDRERAHTARGATRAAEFDPRDDPEASARLVSVSSSDAHLRRRQNEGED